MAMSKFMTFKRYGRTYQLRIRDAGDLAGVLELDEAHWVATGAPTATINCDATFLDLLDTDNNGRLMCFELRDAIEWAGANLRDTAGLTEGAATLRLDAINTDEPDGQAVHAAARKILDRLGLPDAQEVTLEQVRRIKKQVEATPVSEAGVVLPAASDDPEVRGFIADIIRTVGGAPHPSGEHGVNEAEFEEFVEAARGYLDWLAQSDIPPGQDATEIMPLGERTGEAFELFAGLRGKVDQYFAQCEAVAFDARAAGRVGISDEEFGQLDLTDPDAIEGFIRRAPLAKPKPERMLPFEEEINPSYGPQLARLRTEVIAPAMGGPAAMISYDQWRQVKGFLAAHEAWRSAKIGEQVEPLGADRLARYLDEKICSAVRDLIAASAKTAFVLDTIRLTEKLILCQAHLIDLANNFVSFPHLYDPDRRAMFELGTLIMDNRHFNLAVRVTDRAAHQKIARSGCMFVLYVAIMPSEGREPYEVAVPVTSSGKGNLCAGKRGLFRDIHGGESDARIVAIIPNPISLGEALISPFQRLGRLLSGKIESLTASAEKKLDATATKALEQSKAPAPAGRGMMAGGLLMGGGVAIAAVGSALTYIGKTITPQNYGTVLAVIAAAILAVIVPTVIVATLKLRRRDLSAILEGSGWAINARMRLTRSQYRFFTRRPRYPLGAVGIRRRWVWVLVTVAAIVLTLSAVGLIRLKLTGKTPATAPAPTQKAP